MEGQMTRLTHKQQPLARSILWRGMATVRAGLAGTVGVYFHRHAAGQQRLVSDVAVQLGKCPLGGRLVGVALLYSWRLSACTLGPLAHMCQVLQREQAGGVGAHDLPANDVVAVLLQPSLSPADDEQTPCRGASAF